ncbi:unnamed protein product, partial [Staurois parvus]
IDPLFSDLPLLPLSPNYLLIEQRFGVTLHKLSLVCIARESECDQHRANQHCPVRGQETCILPEEKKNYSFKLYPVLCWTFIEVTRLLQLLMRKGI